MPRWAAGPRGWRWGPPAHAPSGRDGASSPEGRGRTHRSRARPDPVGGAASYGGGGSGRMVYLVETKAHASKAMG